MKAVILVGGFGTRLRPLTLTTPKQMLPVVGQPMIERVVAGLARHGVTDAVLALGYRPDQFSDAYPDGTIAGVRMHYAIESEPLDTAGAIAFAAREAGFENETVIAVNGDILTDQDVTALLELHRATGAEGTIALSPVDDPSRFGVVPIDDDGRVEAFIEKPPADEAPTNWINAGTYVLEPSALARVEPGRKVSIERETFPDMVAEGVLYAKQLDGYWVDAGKPDAYFRVALDYTNGVRGTEAAVASDATVADDASVTDSIVEAGATIGAGVTLVRSMITAGATVEAGARLTDTIVGARSTVGPGCTLTDVVIGEDQWITPGGTAAGVNFPEVPKHIK